MDAKTSAGPASSGESQPPADVHRARRRRRPRDGAGVLTARPSAGQPVREARWSTLSGIRSTPWIRRYRTPDSLGRLLNSFLDPLVWRPEPGKFVAGLATAWQVTPDATRFTFTLREGVEVPRRHAVQRGRGQGHVRPHRRSAAEGAPDRAARPLRRRGRPGRPPDPVRFKEPYPALPALPELGRAPAGVPGRREEMGRRLRPEPRGHRPVRAHEVHARGDHLRALRRLQLGAGLPGPQGAGLPGQGGPALRAGGVDAGSSRSSAASRSWSTSCRTPTSSGSAPIRSSPWT